MSVILTCLQSYSQNDKILLVTGKITNFHWVNNDHCRLIIESKDALKGDKINIMMFPEGDGYVYGCGDERLYIEGDFKISIAKECVAKDSKLEFYLFFLLAKDGLNFKVIEKDYKPFLISIENTKNEIDVGEINLSGYY